MRIPNSPALKRPIPNRIRNGKLLVMFGSTSPRKDVVQKQLLLVDTANSKWMQKAQMEPCPYGVTWNDVARTEAASSRLC
ncbi:hypothetical protein PGTUg99_034114 [Puccinia graminis f. sp. tritici]|uniref:Uncharacterized protein n=1 Tax=Puccinia graminis f. sp. tritici TaxID=56615 RepID=A0A5B0P5D2_PUCGR|nr:hypothetical protein PGTUg99_034114 [Puccinia graminis f. sp. tritici]